MTSIETIRRAVLRVAPRAAALLLVLPVLAALLTGNTLQRQDAAFKAAMQGQDGQSVESRAAALQAFGATPPASVCTTSGDKTLDAFRATYCQRWSAQWQLVMAHKVALGIAYAGLALLLAMAAVSLYVARARNGRHAGVVTALRLAAGGTACLLTMQAALLAWLAGMVPARLWQLPAAPFSIVIAVASIVTLAVALQRTRRAVAPPLALHGEVLMPDDAPALWNRMKDVAGRVGTAPPRQLILGTTSQFFATDVRLVVNGKPVLGRTLFASLPLLMQLDADEADALLAHELAQLKDSDAAIWPTLQVADRWLGAASPFTTVLAAPVALQRLLLDLALHRVQRERSLGADVAAARVTSPTAMAQALVKAAGYSAYRAGAPHGEAQELAAGLPAFANADDFPAVVAKAAPAHLFNTYPPLAERIASMGASLTAAGYSHAMLARGAGWCDDIPNLSRVEQRTWGRAQAA
ncbi:M48 family metalloprotease [Massilia sp. PAMC28688]|uniref:M48 family metalloprotease n=1 Tax=Massilia sp. PAMC28688 TaxID=2861283 RepID=UPI001C632BFB|nr:M48 family metalloprotease [Massilia sp. PAMC28688]QYF92372.1 M48 family metalloprotease [Massilia sp. PAMC28688]